MAPKISPPFRAWLAKHVDPVNPPESEEDEERELVSLVENSANVLPDADPDDSVAVLGFDIAETEFIADIRDRVDDIRDLRIDTRQAWRRYQRRLEDAEGTDGVDEFNYKAEAKDAKADAQTKQQRFEQLWAEVLEMRRIWRKHQKLKDREDEKERRRFQFSEAQARSVGKAADRLTDHREREEEHRQNIGQELDRAGMDVEINLDDIDKSVAALERANMGDVTGLESEPKTEVETEESDSKPPERH